MGIVLLFGSISLAVVFEVVFKYSLHVLIYTEPQEITFVYTVLDFSYLEASELSQHFN